jgi:hypothetical protein
MNQNDYIKQFDKIIVKADQLKVLLANNVFSKQVMDDCQSKSNEVVETLKDIETNFIQEKENKNTHKVQINLK